MGLYVGRAARGIALLVVSVLVALAGMLAVPQPSHAADKSVEFPVAATDLVYSGQEQRGVAEGDGYTLTGTTAAVNAGTYTATATLVGADYHWTDGTTKPKEISWTISPKPIAVPGGETLAYSGNQMNALDDDSLGSTIPQVSLGDSHSAAVLRNGDLYTWGYNNHGQLGNGTTTERNTPVKVSLSADAVQVSLGYSHSAAVLDNGDLYTWGWNASGQLGDGTTTERHAPVKVLSGVKQISLGYSHSAALLDNGDLYMWGSNASGQLGDGTTTGRRTPVKVLSGVAQVSLGAYHSAAILDNGDLYTWGSNASGQLGDDTTQNRQVPTKVLSGVAQASLGDSHSAAVLENGDLYMWGRNASGRIGDGTWTNRSTPVKVLSGVAQASLGYAHSAAILKNGDLYTWGDNSFSRLGDGTWINHPTPAKVLSDAQQVSLGSYHSAAVLKNGDLYTWGYNHEGQLGDGTTEVCRTPAAALVPHCFGTSDYEGAVGRDEPVVLLFTYTAGVTSDAVVASTVGTYRCYASPGDNYCWEDGSKDPKAVEWVVTPASLAQAKVSAADQAYTGSALTPAPTVTLNGKTLKAGTDYTVSYADNTEVGTATVTVTGKGDYTGTATGTFKITAAPEPDPDPADTAWTRLAGGDRFGTMKAITLEGYDKAGTVLVATGLDFADALAAAGLSGVLHAPIVTTMPGSLSAEARDAIKALGAKEAIILGGTSAVSAQVEKQLKAMGLSTSRLAGDNRIDTAVRIWKRGGDAWGGTCILSKGWVAADALAAGSFAYADSAPLFLALPDGTLTPETAAAVASFDHVVVLGGTGGDAAISDKTAKSLGTSWMRVAGDTRYETAVALATWASGGDTRAAFQPEVELSWQDAAVAFAWNYPDALVGVNATGPKASVTLLASTDADDFTQGAADAVAQHADEVSHGYVLGGTGVVSDAVKQLFEEAAK